MGEDGTRPPTPGTVATITMGQRAVRVALYDGQFWRTCDALGPIKCAPAAITSIETPYIFSPPAPTDEDGSVFQLHIDPPQPRVPHPCESGLHRWAWLVDGRQACGHCSKPRPT